MRRIVCALMISAAAAAAQARNLYIPVAGSTAGAGGTYFRTDVRIFNPSFTRDIDVTIHFLPQGQDNSNISGQVFQVPKRQMVVLNDIVNSLAGWTPPLVGALRIDSDTDADYNVIVDSRTYTDSPNPAAPGTFGQFIPALDVNTAARKSVAVHVANSDGYRANAVLMNPNRVPASVIVSVVLGNGALAAPETIVTLQPMSMLLMPVGALAGGRPFDDAFLHFDSNEPIFSGVSVVDNQSSDQFFVPGEEDRDEVKPFAGAFEPGSAYQMPTSQSASTVRVR